MRLFLIGLLVAGLMALASCYKCADPQCSNVPNVNPDYPPFVETARDSGRD